MPSPATVPGAGPGPRPGPAALRAGAERWLLVAATGGREYLADNPLRVTAVTLLPRAILQTVFLVLLADLSGTRPPHFAFLGAVAVAMTLATTVGIVDVPSNDKWSGTFWRIRIGGVAPFTVIVLRCWPYPFAGFATAVVTFVVLAPMFGGGWAWWLLPILAVCAMSASAVGLAGAAFAVGRRADVLVGNLLSYLMLLGCGGVVPAGRLGWLGDFGMALPLWHGLAAARAAQAGRPVGGELLGEAAVAAGWLVAAWVLILVQTHRAQVNGNDGFSRFW